MGVLNDFFLASDEELAALDARSGPWPPPVSVSTKKRWWSRDQTAHDAPPGGPSLPVVDAKGILDVEWAVLERLLHDESVDDVDAVVDLITEPVRQEPADQPEAWISPVSDRLVAALADSDENRLAVVVPKWLETEEMALTGWDTTAATGLLIELGELCRRGRAENRRVYRWVSL